MRSRAFLATITVYHIWAAKARLFWGKGGRNVKKNVRIIILLLALAWCVLIWHFSLASGAESADTSGDVLEFINGILTRLGSENLFTHQTVRKIAHFVEFFALGVLFAAVYFAFDFPHFVFFALPSVFAVACVDEFIQRFSPDRTSAFLDVCLDFAGGTCGVMLFYLAFCLVFVLCQRKAKKVQK